jgi:hypothetical protein
MHLYGIRRLVGHGFRKLLLDVHSEGSRRIVELTAKLPTIYICSQMVYNETKGPKDLG